MKRSLLFISIFIATHTQAQEISDSAKSLGEVLIKGYETNGTLFKVPASVTKIRTADLKSTSAFSLLPAVNTASGVKMEERSPGSYRLSIRGSLLRSPFGIRNIKIYFDDFILTDAGGNTYLNLLDIQSIQSLEIIKGPAGSLYGAGTGGAVLLNGIGQSKDSLDMKLRLIGGSFGTLNESFSYQKNTNDYSIHFLQGHFQSDGYRVQSAMRKDNIQLNLKLRSSVNNSLQFLLLYSDLNYQTPGGLTLAQFTANPRQARPATATLPSVVDQRTAIFNKTALMGLSNTYVLNRYWKTVSTFTNALTGFKNPFITNYEKRREYNIGLRSKIIYENNDVFPLQWVTGFEIQRGDYTIDSSGNNKGVSDGKLVRDAVAARQQFAFSQLNFQPLQFLTLQAGLSLNKFTYSIERTIGLPSRGKYSINFNRQLLPRIGANITPVEHISFFGQLSKGYSSPSVAEIRPSASGIYTGLQAEYGWNKEVGFRFEAIRKKLFFSTSLFQFDLKDAIVRRVNNVGAEYFMNEGDIKQKGIEVEYQYNLINLSGHRFIQSLKWSQALTFNDFRFVNYKNNTTSYAGNKLTGVADKMISTNLALGFMHSVYWNIQFNYVGKMPLNDANTFFGGVYRLWQSKWGWKSRLKKIPFEFFLLMDNIGNERYSLGYDINAFGNRFYNAAPTRNFQIGVIVDLR